MPRSPSKPALYPKVRDLFDRYTKGPNPQTSLAEIVERSGLGKSTVGELARGNLKGLDPQVANELVRWVPFTMAELMEAYGFNIKFRPTERLPEGFAGNYPLTDRTR